MHALRIFVFTLLCFIHCSTPTRADDTSRLTIAFVLPLTGDWGFLGNGIKNSALLAQEDLKQEGVRITLLFEDNRGDLTTSATAATRLLADGKVDAFVSIISGVGKLLKPIAEKAQVLNVGICSDTEVAGGTYSFINYLTAEQGAAKYVEYFTSNLGSGKSVGIYSMNEAGFREIVDEVQAQAVRSAIRVRFVEYFDRGTSDFRSILLRHRSQSPDALLILGLSPEIELIARQARSIGISTPLTSIEGFGLSSDQGAFDGAWFVDAAAPNSQFRNRFRDAFGQDVTAGAGHAYDTVLLLAHAFGRQRSESQIDRVSAAKKLREISDFAGVTGKLRVSSDGVIWSEASVKKIVNGQAVVAEP